MSTTTTTSTTSSTTVTNGSGGDNPPPPPSTQSTKPNNQTNGHKHHHHHHHHKQTKKTTDESQNKEGDKNNNHTKNNNSKPPKKPKQFTPKGQKEPKDKKEQVNGENHQQQQESIPGEQNQQPKPKRNRPKYIRDKIAKPDSTTTTTTTTTTTKTTSAAAAAAITNTNSEDEELSLPALLNLGKFKNESISEAPLCIICCDPIIMYSRGPCDHIDVCALCVLKQRELYKEYKCSICKQEQGQVIFSNVSDKKYIEYNVKEMTFSKELGVYFENKEFLTELSVLWSYNCKLCNYPAESLRKLEYHLNTRHHLVYCEICLSDRKVFLYQQNIYDPRELPIHLAEWNGGASKEQKKAKKGHPVCKFCNKYFYGIDQLYEHLNKNHFTCFLCEKQGIQYQYFKDYQKLRYHFDDEHFPCTDPECLEKKYIVFQDEVSLRSHKISTHMESNKFSRTEKKSMGNIRNLIDFNISSSSSGSTNSNVISSSSSNNNNNNSGSSNSSINNNNLAGSNRTPTQEQFPAIGSSSENILLGNRAPTSFNPDFHLVRLEQQQIASKQVSQSEMEERNKKLMQQINSILSQEKRNEFKARSLDFKNGKIGVNEYYTKFIALFGKDKAAGIFEELVALLPDQSKREELIQIHSFMKHLEEQYPSLDSGSDSKSNKKKSNQTHTSVWTSNVNASDNLHQIKKKPTDQVLSYNQTTRIPTPVLIHNQPTTTTTTTSSSNSMASKIQQRSISYDDSDSDSDDYPTLPTTNNFSKIQMDSKPFSSFSSTTSSSKPSLSKKLPNKDDFPSLPGSDKPLPKPQPVVVEKKEEKQFITKGGKKKQVFYL
ncbi:hypothetical protein DLAC_10714 [Tieghemostelium lacteum]|uniref:RING-type E3 ubiquitin transferase n=1 Tax=Tieghemostelium lacteum TaxID=361077 RepID=A0A151Z3Z7_TIELA|nr:hypothetical protein DLAC_10714 [Tieghemostelium lacteum]|eukprot:KYQ88690.1 hypothetical protein DLAC_10714 [Tieghemostelium lacteum]